MFGYPNQKHEEEEEQKSKEMLEKEEWPQMTREELNEIEMAIAKAEREYVYVTPLYGRYAFTIGT